MLYGENYGYGGMHLFWWVLWFLLLFWIFVLPYRIPGQKSNKETALDILKKRLAAGEISNEEYLKKKSLMKEN